MAGGGGEIKILSLKEAQNGYVYWPSFLSEQLCIYLVGSECVCI